METNIYKNAFNSWTCETNIKLSNDREIHILSMKRWNDRMVTTMVLNKILSEDADAKVTTPASKSISLSDEKIRCTRKAVLQHHIDALQDNKSIINNFKQENQ